MQHPINSPSQSMLLLRELLSDQSAPVGAGHVAVVVAHPDDETIGCGAQLSRWRQATVVLVTDGAPRNLIDARACGFATAESYALERRQELAQALAIAGVPERQLSQLAIPDQEAALRLPELARRLTDIFDERGITVAVTHAYEGGHPDHDAVAFAVHAAAMVRASTVGVDIIEMPFYRTGVGGGVAQQFEPREGVTEIEVPLDPGQQSLKRRMMAAHVTQLSVLAGFAADVERFRVAPAYDFTALPNGGRLLYEGHNWGITGSRWQQLANEAQAALGLRPSAA